MVEAINKSFGKSVGKPPNILLLSTDLFHFSNIARRYCWVLKPFRNPHWYLANIFSKHCDICSNMHFSNIFDKLGRMIFIDLIVKETSTKFCVVLIIFHEVMRLQSFWFNLSDVIPTKWRHLHECTYITC